MYRYYYTTGGAFGHEDVETFEEALERAAYDYLTGGVYPKRIERIEGQERTVVALRTEIIQLHRLRHAREIDD